MSGQEIVCVGGPLDGLIAKYEGGCRLRVNLGIDGLSTNRHGEIVPNITSTTYCATDERDNDGRLIYTVEVAG